MRKLDLRGNDALTAQVLIGYWRSKCKWSARSCVGLCVYGGSRRAKQLLDAKVLNLLTAANTLLANRGTCSPCLSRCRSNYFTILSTHEGQTRQC